MGFRRNLQEILNFEHIVFLDTNILKINPRIFHLEDYYNLNSKTKKDLSIQIDHLIEFKDLLDHPKTRTIPEVTKETSVFIEPLQKRINYYPNSKIPKNLLDLYSNFIMVCGKMKQKEINQYSKDLNYPLYLDIFKTISSILHLKKKKINHLKNPN